MSLVVGVDFGTLSARAVVVDATDGAELGHGVFAFPHGVMTPEPQWALQDAADYVEALRTAVPAAIADAGVDPAHVVGIATDFTASSPLPVRADGTPLAPVRLWKHHAAQRQADRINALARDRGEPWLARYGGRISSEWAVAKALQVLEEEPELYMLADRWIEAADWITWQLCGRETRNAALAGYKAIHQDGTYPSPAFFAALDERFADFATKLDGPLMPLGARAGALTPQAAAWTGLRPGIAVAVGNVDAHVTAPAARAIDPGQLLMIMGTSTCHVMNGDHLAEVPGMCGVVRDGIVPGLYGYEAGQTGVGDCFAWVVDMAGGEHERLSEIAGAQEVGAHGLIALDWLNGNRSVLVDHELSGLIVGLTLATRAEDIYRALVEATAFGTRVILDAFAAAGLPTRELMVAGGLIQNPFVMQVYADVTRLPLHVIGSEQGPALGSAMHAAVAAGLHPDIRTAAANMGKLTRDAYAPDERRADAYDALYARYVRLHDHFGRGGDDVMHELRRVRPRELAHG
jgi:L-ribulokinase